MPGNTDATEPDAFSEEVKETEPHQVISMDFTKLQDINQDIGAWLLSEDKPIDYPVLQADDNRCYLNHLYTGEINGAGSLFLDYRNTGLFTDRNSVIYGHHIKNESMFHTLEGYKKQDYYDSHPIMILYTPDGDYLVELISGTIEDGMKEFVKFDFENEEDFTEYVNALRSRSTFQSTVELQPDDRLLSLCTCSYEWSEASYLVVGRLTPIMTGNQ